MKTDIIVVPRGKKDFTLIGTEALEGNVGQ